MNPQPLDSESNTLTAGPTLLQEEDDYGNLTWFEVGEKEGIEIVSDTSGDEGGEGDDGDTPQIDEEPTVLGARQQLLTGNVIHRELASRSIQHWFEGRQITA